MDAAVRYSIVNRSTSLEDAVIGVKGDSVADEYVVAGGSLKKNAVLSIVADGVIAKYVIVGVLDSETMSDSTVVDCVADEGVERGIRDHYATIVAIGDEVAG